MDGTLRQTEGLKKSWSLRRWTRQKEGLGQRKERTGCPGEGLERQGGMMWEARVKQGLRTTVHFYLCLLSESEDAVKLGSK